MADQYIKIRSDFFESELIKQLEKHERPDLLITIYLNLLCDAKNTSIYRPFKNDMIITAEMWGTFLYRTESEIEYAFKVLTETGLIKVFPCYVEINRFFISDKNIRVTQEYRNWRLLVLKRDQFKCQLCGNVGKSLHAHHIKSFNKHKELMFNADNGITLCQKCHVELHKTDRDWR